MDNAESKLPLATVLAVRLQAMIIAPDLPGHGYSDGLYGYISNWHDFVDRVSDLLEAVLPALRTSVASDKVFLFGQSMGGAVATTLLIKKPTAFSGGVLVAPMWFISDEMKPPYVVELIFTKILVHLLPTWAICPNKS